MTFIDDHTRLCWVYLMKKKSDVEQIFKDFYAFFEIQFQIKISILKTDNGTKYFNDCLGTFFFLRKRAFTINPLVGTHPNKTV